MVKLSGEHIYRHSLLISAMHHHHHQHKPLHSNSIRKYKTAKLYDAMKIVSFIYIYKSETTNKFQLNFHYERRRCTQAMFKISIIVWKEMNNFRSTRSQVLTGMCVCALCVYTYEYIHSSSVRTQYYFMQWKTNCNRTFVKCAYGFWLALY